MLEKVTGPIFNLDAEESIKMGIAELIGWQVKPNSSATYKFDSDFKLDMSVLPGNYTALVLNENEDVRITMMSDTQNELRTNQEFIEKAQGDVLIGGLGIGMLIYNLRHKIYSGEVHRVTIVEKFQDVIDLVWPYYKELDYVKYRVEVVRSDVFDYKPTRNYQTIYMDIWPDICVDNLPDIYRLHRKYSQYLDRSAGHFYLDSWVRRNLKLAKRKEDQLVKLLEEQFGPAPKFEALTTDRLVELLGNTEIYGITNGSIGAEVPDELRNQLVNQGARTTEGS